MKKIHDQCRFQPRSHTVGVILRFLCALVLLGGATIESQDATIKGTIDAVSEDGFVTLKGVKVFVRDWDKRENKPGPTRTIKVVDDGQYEINLPGGAYEIFACDRHLEYEPYTRLIDLKEGGNPKKINFRLRRQPTDANPSDEKGKPIGANVTVCLRHLETGCEVQISTDKTGKVTVPGIPEHFEVRDRGGQKCD